MAFKYVNKQESPFLVAQPAEFWKEYKCYRIVPYSEVRSGKLENE